MWVGGYSDWTPAEQREWDRDLAELETERKPRESPIKTETNNENTVKSNTITWDIDLATETLYRNIINKIVIEKTTKIIFLCYSCTYLDKPCSVELLPGTCIKEVLQKLMRTIETEIEKKQGHALVLKGVFSTRHI